MQKKKKHGCERLPVDKYNQPKIYQNLEKNTRKLKFRPEIPNTIPSHNTHPYRYIDRYIDIDR